MRRKKFIPFAITWMKLGGRSVKQNKTKMNIVWSHFFVKSKKQEKKRKKRKQMHRNRE